ncbi:ribosomal protein S5 domain 2-type protein [Coprinopsis sp. MPI-PUGE-AT-0042]|nr:ribosomal protein S5 domain 2-type protein [Coprinopsis sp. MPI-PUGE-AT-0042]
MISKAESAYIQSGLLQSPPQRLDGRSLTDYRPISLETGVAPLANGSAKLNIGRNPHDGSGGTEVVAATKLEVETIEEGGKDGGRVVVTVTCSPAAYPGLSSNALEDLQHDLTTLLHTTLSHPTLHPSNLSIIPSKKSWLLNLDLVVLADEGNVYDALFMASRAALWDTKVPRTKVAEFKATKKGGAMTSGVVGGSQVGGREDGMDVDDTPALTSGFDTRQPMRAAMDFELPDYWDEGEALDGRERWPLCVTLNMNPPAHLLDATPAEELSVPLKLLVITSFPPSTGKSTTAASSSSKPSSKTPIINGMRFLGPGEIKAAEVKDLVGHATSYASTLHRALDDKLEREDIRRGVKERENFGLGRQPRSN